MHRLYIDRSTMLDFLRKLNESFAKPGRLYLVGESIQVYEGWTDWTDRLEFAVKIASDDRQEFEEIVNDLRVEMEVDVLEESPSDVIPLPSGHMDRKRLPGQQLDGYLRIFHYDPYSVAFRLITRGDETDYRAVLAFLQHGWITVEVMDELLEDLLPQFTRETIAQDPAEFRRKYRGLLQMWRAM